MSDFPNSVSEAELLEQYKGGMNAFVHLSLPDDILVDIEESKVSCNDCGKIYFSEGVYDAQNGIHIDPFVPKDGHCVDCGSDSFAHGSDPHEFEADL